MYSQPEGEDVVFPARRGGRISRGHRIVGQKVPGAIAIGGGWIAADGIGPIKRYLEGSSPRAVEVVERFPAPIIIGLVRRDAGLEEEVGWACLIADDKNNVGLRTTGSRGQFREIHSADPFLLISQTSDS